MGLSVLQWRKVGTDTSCLGSMTVTTKPVMGQVFVVPTEAGLTEEEEQGYF